MLRAAAEPVSVPLVEVYLTDRLDLTYLASVRAVLDNAVRLCPDRLVVDMAECSGIDAAGVALLLDVHRHLLRAGARLTLRAPTQRLLRILQIARVEQVFHIIPSDREALDRGEAVPATRTA